MTDIGITKEHDWVLETLWNPTFTNTDFKVAGIDSNNTSIQPLNVYLTLPEILRLPAFQTAGKFDRTKVEDYYRKALVSYNKLAKDTYEEDLTKDLNAIFAYNDIFVSPEKRMKGPLSVMTFLDNPTRLTFGVVEINTPGRLYKTIEEIALLNQIWDSNTNSFTTETPEDSFFKNFFRPMALAVWEYDADANGNKTSDPNKIVHHLGDMKLHNGEPYYEFLNGKSGYGKLILSKMNILTKEDSWINKFDFFDSDDMKKSTFGSMMLNTARIVPLFIPYVGPAYMYTSLALSGTEALATLGKMFTNSNNSTLNEVTSFISSLNAGVSDYGKQHAFSMENVLNMVGDTFQFINGQRLLAENAPAWFGSKIMNEEQIMTKATSLAEAETVRELSKAQGLLSKAEYETRMSQIMGVNLSKYLKMLQTLVLNYLKLGQQISRNYMAITFGTHTYGAAKAEGVEDLPATLLTLGAIAGQYALLSSHIGKWIFPEAGILAQQNKMIIEKLPEYVNNDAFKTIVEGIGKATTKAEKLKWAERMWNKGKDFVNKVYSTPIQTTALAALTGAVASGVEMTSFAVLDDLVGQVYNTAQWISGNPHRMHPWENMFERYATSFLGGAVAGAMSIPELKKAAKQIHNITPEFAYKQMIQMVAEGKADELLKYVDKVKWTTSDLSAEKFVDTPEGRVYELGTPTDNQNEAIRKGIRNEIQLVKETLLAHNALIGSEGLLSAELRGPLKIAYMQNSTVVKDYISDYYDVLSKIVLTSKEINNIPDPLRRIQEKDIAEADKEYKELQRKAEASKKEEDKKAAEAAKKNLDDLNKLSSKKADLAELIDLKNKFLSGELAPNYMKRAIYDMSKAISDPTLGAKRVPYAENKFGKNFNLLSAQEKAEALRDYLEFKKTNGSAYIEGGFELFEPINDMVSDFLKDVKNKDISKNLDFNDTTVLKHIQTSEKFESSVLKALQMFSEKLSGTETLNTAQGLHAETTKGIFYEILKDLRGTRPENLDPKFNFIFDDAEVVIAELGRKLNEAGRELLNLKELKEEKRIPEDHFLDVKDDLNNYMDYLLEAKIIIESMLYSGWITDILEGEVSKLKLVTPTLYTKLTSTIDFLSKFTKDLSSIHTMSRKYKLNDDGKYVEVNEILEILPKQYERALTDLSYYYLGEEEETIFSGIKRHNKLQNLAVKVKDLQHFDVVDLLNEFGKKLTNGEFDFTTIYKIFSDLYINNISDLELYLVGQADLNNIEVAIDVLKLFKSGVIAANDVVREFDNIFGYNTTVNSMLGNNKLTVLPESDTAILLDSLNAMLELLEFFYNLTYIANSGKFKELLKVDTDSIFNIYKQLSKKFDNIPDTWTGKLELLNEINTIENLKDLVEAGSRDLTTKLLNQLFKGLIDFETAIHKFFLKNKDKVKDVNVLSDFLGKIFDCYVEGKPTEAIGDKADFVDDNALIYYLAQICALDPNIYFSNLTNSIINGLAPTVVQSYAVRGMLSFVEDPEALYDNFRKAYNINISKHNTAKNHILHASYKNIYLTEAGPGAGKSSGVLPLFISFMRNLDKGKLKNIWFASTSKKDKPNDPKSADDIRDKSNILPEECKIFTKQTLMDLICGKYEVTIDENNRLNLGEDDFNYNTETGIATYKNNTVNQNLDPNILPKILVIDECSDYSDLDLRLIDDFAEKYKVKVLLLGDLRQTKLKGEVKTSDGTYHLNIFRQQFARTFLNNTSFRTNNTLQDYNFALDRALFLPLASMNDQATLEYRYYTDETGLYGRYVKIGPSLGDQELKANFDLMLDTLDYGEEVDEENKPMIGFVYDSEEGELYKYAKSLPNEKLERIEFHKKFPIKGVESKYYVLELSPTVTSIEAFLNYKEILYTAFSRAKLGNIIHMNDVIGGDIIFASKKQNSNGLLRPPTEAIVTYIQQLREFLPTIYTKALTLPNVTPGQTSGGSSPDSGSGGGPSAGGPSAGPSGGPTPSGGEPPKKDDEKPAEEHLATEVEKNEGSNFSDIFMPIAAHAIEEEINRKNDNGVNIIVDTVNKKINLESLGNDKKTVKVDREKFVWELYTAFNNYTGLIEDPDLGYKESSKSDVRFDNYYGLKRAIELFSGNKNLLLSTDTDNAELVEDNVDVKKTTTLILQKLREMIWYTEDFDELQNNIEQALKKDLGLTKDFKDFYIRFMWESSYVRDSDSDPTSPHEELYSAFRSKQEKLDGINGAAKDNKEISGKGLALHIGSRIQDADGKEHDTVILSVPFAKLPNPYTILHLLATKNGKAWALSLEAMIDRTSGLTLYLSLMKIASTLENTIKTGAQPNPGQISLYYLIRAYLFNSDGYSPIIRYNSKGLFGNNIKWTPASTLHTTSPFIVSSTKGVDYLSNKDFYANIDRASGTTERRVEYTPISEIYDNEALTASLIYVTEKDVVDSSGNVRIKKGDPFILAGTRFDDKYESMFEKDLFRLLLEELDDSSTKERVNVTYVNPPRATIKEYLNQLKGYSKTNPPKYFIGNDFTTFRMLQLLSINKLGEKSYLDDIYDNLAKVDKDEVKKFKLGFESFMKKLTEKLDTVFGEGKGLEKLEDYDDRENSNKAFKMTVELMRNDSDVTTSRGKSLRNSQVLKNLLVKLLLTSDLPLKPINETTYRERIFSKLEEFWTNRFGNETIPYNIIYRNDSKAFTLGSRGDDSKVTGVAVYKVSVDPGYKIAGKEFTVNIVRTPILSGDIFPIIASIGYCVKGDTVGGRDGFTKRGLSGIRRPVGEGKYETISLLNEGIRMPETWEEELKKKEEKKARRESQTYNKLVEDINSKWGITIDSEITIRPDGTISMYMKDGNGYVSQKVAEYIIKQAFGVSSRDLLNSTGETRGDLKFTTGTGIEANTVLIARKGDDGFVRIDKDINLRTIRINNVWLQKGGFKAKDMIASKPEDYDDYRKRVINVKNKRVNRTAYEIDTEHLRSLGLEEGAKLADVKNASKEGGYLWFKLENDGKPIVKFTKEHIRGFENHKIIDYQLVEGTSNTVEVILLDKSNSDLLYKVRVTLRDAESLKYDTEIISSTEPPETPLSELEKVMKREHLVSNLRALGGFSDSFIEKLLNPNYNEEFAIKLVERNTLDEDFVNEFKKYRKSLKHEDECPF